MGSYKMHNFSRTLLIVHMVLCSVLILSNCSTVSIDKYQDLQKPIYKESTQAPGLLMHIKPMLNGAEVKEYFGVNLIKKDILAVYISASNTNPSKNYILTEDSIKITQEMAGGANTRPEKESNDAATIASGIGIGALAGSAGIAATGLSLSYPAWVASGVTVAVPIAEYAIPVFVSSQLSNASVIKENFESQKFRATTLEIGEKKKRIFIL